MIYESAHGFRVFTPKRRVSSAARKAKQAARRRERYATDLLYRERQKAKGRRKRRPKVLRMKEDPSVFLACLDSALRLTRSGQFQVSQEPFNPRIHEPGVTVFAVRRNADEGGHLIGLIELTELEVRVSYVFRTYRGLLDALAARLRERFR